jgi:catechol 2,3-dioxygenase-like lactoylglutathione lyase family enzyme
MAVGPLGQVHISVRDVDRSIGFYRDVLGMHFQFRVPGQPMAFFSSGDVRLYLGTPEHPEFTSRCVLYFNVDDLDAEYQRLGAAGVQFLDEPHMVHRDDAGELWMVFLTDPDGHQIGLMQRR